MDTDAMKPETVHDLKCWPMYFERVLDGSKPFEVRRNDRRFAVGDGFVVMGLAAPITPAALAGPRMGDGGWVTVTEDEATWPLAGCHLTTLYEDREATMYLGVLTSPIRCGNLDAAVLRQQAERGHFGWRWLPWPTATPRAAGDEGLMRMVKECLRVMADVPSSLHAVDCDHAEPCSCGVDSLLADLRRAAGGERT